MTVPGAWAGVLLALATYRILRLVAVDEITATIRGWVCGIPDAGYEIWAKHIEDARAEGHDPWQISQVPLTPRRYYLAKLVHCPWCLGWWISLAVFAAYELWPHGTVVAAVPFALSAGCAIIGRNLDG